MGRLNGLLHAMHHRGVASPAPVYCSPVPVYDISWLFNSFKNRTRIELRGVSGVINQIQAEDGSGKSYNVKFDNERTVYIRTN